MSRQMHNPLSTSSKQTCLKQFSQQFGMAQSICWAVGVVRVTWTLVCLFLGEVTVMWSGRI